MLFDCTWEPLPNGDVQCPVCKTVRGSARHRNCGPDHTLPVLDCVHRGEVTGAIALVDCATCGGSVRKKLDVHACAIFGECLPSRSGIVQSIASARYAAKAYQGCGGCQEREPKVTV